MAVLIDSWAWIEYFKGSPAGEQVRPYLSGSHELLISTINAAEVYRSFLSTQNERDAKQAAKFMICTAFPIPVSLSIALFAAHIRHEKKFGLGDAIIMATARKHHADILTGDPDFKNEEQVIYIGK